MTEVVLTPSALSRSLADQFRTGAEIKYILYGGKGGLGKTTLSAATAYWLAKEGRRVCIFSTDPQASLSDIFEKRLFGAGEVELMPNLFALEIDADKRIAAYQDEIRQKILDMYRMEKLPDEVEDYIRSAAAEPAMAESATFDAMVDLMTSGRYEHYIFDMMPHGHAIRFLGMADILDQWVEKILDTRKKAKEYTDMAKSLGRTESIAREDEILKELEYIRSRLDFVSKVVRDKVHTAFFYVLTPELLPILDTAKALQMFSEFNVTVSGVMVNQVYPNELLTDRGVPEFLKSRIRSQQNYLQRIEKDFGPIIRGIVPMMEREPKGLDMIEKIANILLGE